MLSRLWSSSRGIMRQQAEAVVVVGEEAGGRGCGRRRRVVAAMFVVGVGVAGVSCGDDVGEAVVAEFAFLIVQATECVGSGLHPLCKQARYNVDAEVVMFAACSMIMSEQR